MQALVAFSLGEKSGSMSLHIARGLCKVPMG